MELIKSSKLNCDFMNVFFKPILGFFMLISSVVFSQTTKVIDNKGTIREVESSRWTSSGNDIYIKNTANVGIGTPTPDASAKLDVCATNKGFLPPRINLTSATDITTFLSPAVGLLVYCIGASNLVAGYYFWNGTTWVNIATAVNEKFASGFVGRGQDITLGNLKVRLSASGNNSIQVSTVSGTYSVIGAHYLIIGTSETYILGTTTIKTTPAYLNGKNNFIKLGWTAIWTIMDTSKKISWRITYIIGSNYKNNFISIERLS